MIKGKSTGLPFLLKQNKVEVALQKKDGLEAVLTINISKDDYSPRVEAELKKTQKKVNVPGFRPGHAPMGMVKKMYGKGIYVDEVNRLASEAMYNYLDENKIEYLAQPIMADNADQKINFDAEEDFTFMFEIGLAPKVDLELSEKDKVTRYKITVSDAELDKEIDTIQRRYSKEETAETAEEKDIVYLNATELDDAGKAPLDGGVADKNISTTPELVKDKTIQKKLVGAKVGDEFIADIFKMFDNNETVISSSLGIQKEGVADLNKKFSFKVTEIKRFIPAELNQELFDTVFGQDRVSDLDGFKALLKEDLEKYYAQEAENMFEHNVDHLIYDKHIFDLPEQFLKRWLVENNKEDFSPENIEQKYQDEARQLRYVLVRNKVLADNDIKISQEDVENMSMAYSAQMLRQYGMPNADEALIRQISENNKKEAGYMNRVTDMVAQRKFMEVAKSKVKAVEKEVGVEEFYDIIKKHNEEHNH
ncbi:MAG: trigger factor [Bacteroidetes bacterium]|nr:trigger factor [Bacteroidota bacterium]